MLICSIFFFISLLLEDAECELNCKPKGMKYFATLNSSVIDGTPCFRPAEYYRSNYRQRAMCVDGVCKVSVKENYENVYDSSTKGSINIISVKKVCWNVVTARNISILQTWKITKNFTSTISVGWKDEILFFKWYVSFYIGKTYILLYILWNEWTHLLAIQIASC